MWVALLACAPSLYPTRQPYRLLRWVGVLRTLTLHLPSVCHHAPEAGWSVLAVHEAGHTRMSGLLQARCNPLFCGQDIVSWVYSCRWLPTACLATCRPM